MGLSQEEFAEKVDCHRNFVGRIERGEQNPTVDTLVAQHLLKTVTAIRLMGADCIISGIRPQIAQTIVHLGIDLQGITTKASLADALSLALQRTGWRITRQA